MIQAKKWANEVPESDLNTFVDESRKVAVAFAGIVISILICTAEAEEPLHKLIKRRKNNLFLMPNKFRTLPVTTIYGTIFSK